MLAPTVRILLALFGALAGYQIAGRVRLSAFSPGLDQTGNILWYVAFTLAGFVLGWVCGVLLSRLLRRGLDHVDDGTMIVIEDGVPLVGSRVQVEVTSMLQSPSGKMIFSRVVS